MGAVGWVEVAVGLNKIGVIDIILFLFEKNIVTNLWLLLLQLLVLAAGFYTFRRMGHGFLLGYGFVLGLLANLLVLKSIAIGPFDGLSGCDAFMVYALYALNILRAEKGDGFARKTFIASVLMSLLVVACFYIHMAFMPSVSDRMHTTYTALLEPVSQLLMISTGVIAVVMCFDLILFSILNKVMKNQNWAIFCSLTISEALDSALFTKLALSGWGFDLWKVFVLAFMSKFFIICFVICAESIRSWCDRLMDEKIGWLRERYVSF